MGSSGKSTILELTQLVIQCYFKELKYDTFALGNTKLDKILNTYDKEPYIRISWVNEMKDTKIDDSIFKEFCDGKCQTTKLFKDGQYNFPHSSLCVVTANTMPSIKIDSGTSRRLIGYTHKSIFVSKNDKKFKINPQEHIYEKDIELKKK